MDEMRSLNKVDTELATIELNDKRSHALVRKTARWILLAAGAGCAASGFYGVFSGTFSEVTIGTLFTSAVSMLAVAISGKHQE